MGGQVKEEHREMQKRHRQTSGDVFVISGSKFMLSCLVGGRAILIVRIICCSTSAAMNSKHLIRTSSVIEHVNKKIHIFYSLSHTCDFYAISDILRLHWPILCLLSDLQLLVLSSGAKVAAFQYVPTR